jgi:putative endonuclease
VLPAEAGRRAEDAAAVLLVSKGMTLLERNFFARAGEVDLVMKDGDEVVFVEVRARASMGWGGAAQSVGGKKRRRVITAAKLWLAKSGWEGACRFDVVAQEGGEWEHYEAAFDGDGR